MDKASTLENSVNYYKIYENLYADLVKDNIYKEKFKTLQVKRSVLDSRMGKGLILMSLSLIKYRYVNG